VAKPSSVVWMDTTTFLIFLFLILS
jgi:hypothetical protein